MKINNKTLLTRYLKGYRKGWNTPTLPSHITLIHLHPITRIFRFIGGLSLLLVLTNKLNLFNTNFYFIIILYFIVVLYGIYNYFLFFYRVKHIYKLLKDGKDLDILQ